MPAVSIDGMDVLDVYRETQKAVAHCRAGNGPYFVEALTYRYRGHSMADPELYRLKEEIEQARKKDAIERLKRHMIAGKLLDDAAFAEISARVDRDVDAAVAFAEASPEPGLDTLMHGITKEPTNG
jgi:pyruvate dehydrogenase E1 component alpha subunit